MFTKAFILLAVASQAFATVFITNPVSTSSFTGGSDVTVSWIENGDGPTLEEFGPARISIYVGNAQQQTSLQTIEDEVNVATTGSVQFTVDPSIGPDGREYFIRVESLSLKDETQPQYPALAFSAKFGLTGMSGEFTPAIIAQIEGQSTAPLAAPTAAAGLPSASAVGSGSTLASSAAAGSRSASASGSARPTSSAAAGADEKDGAFTNAINVAGLALSALVGFAML
ncbi:hypothetical protein BKA70DRAFT_1271317 [Coprinopsis sp. MPI-PUGE-AT-0042]|nr:hypothetical protein BKA70DRAFT_1271317 [Coprinopsis sp. MPI-PUGE-AT-0042]